MKPIFDEDLLQLRRRRAAANYADHDFLHRQSDEILIERPGDVKGGSFENVAFSGFYDDLAKNIEGRFGIKNIVSSSANLAMSSFELHMINNVPAFLMGLKAALMPGGLFLAGLLGGDTLTELRQVMAEAEGEIYGGISPRVIPFIDVKDAGMLLQKAGFAMPMADIERFNVTYDSIISLAHDLRGMGLANSMTARSRKPAGKQFWLRAGEIYQEKFPAEQGRIRASFDILTLQGWKI